MGWETYAGPVIDWMKSVAGSPLFIFVSLALFALIYTRVCRPRTLDFGFLGFRLKATFPEEKSYSASKAESEKPNDM